MPWAFLTHKMIDQISQYMKNKGDELLSAGEGSYTYENRETRMNSMVLN